MRSFLSFAAVCLLAGCFGCHKAAPGIAFDHELSALIPARSVALAGVDVQQLQGTPFYRRHSGEFNVPLLNGAAESFGFDPRHDVRSLLIAFDSQGKSTVLGKGSFQADAVAAKLAAHGARRSSYRGQSLLLEPDAAVFFPKNGLAVAGPANDIYSAIDSQATRTSGLPETLRVLGEHAPRAAQIWFLSSGGLPLGRLATRSEETSILTSFAGFIQTVAAGVIVDTGLHLDAQLACGSEAGARQVRDAARGLMGFARLSTTDANRSLLQVYDSLKIEQTGASVHLHADLPAELADALLLQYGPGLSGRSGQMLAR